MQTAHDEVRTLIRKLHARIEHLTHRPIDPDVDNLTHMIETLTAAHMIPTVRHQWIGMKLTHLQRRVLELLASKIGTIFGKEAIMNAMYYDRPHEPGHDIVDVFICKIRSEFRRVAAPVWIETVWGLGYRLIDMPALEGAKGLQPHGPGGRLGNQNARKFPKKDAA